MQLPSAPRALVHATSVVLGAACAPFGGAVEGAVLLLGDSGAGKSDVALRLIAMGARLLSDDQTALFAEADRLFAEASFVLTRTDGNSRGRHHRAGSRGAGPVVLAVMLEMHAGIPRLPEPLHYMLPGALGALEGPPLLRLSPFEAANPGRKSPPPPAPFPGAHLSQAWFRLLPALFSEPNAVILRAIPNSYGT